MGTESKNISLNNALKARKDEFYTQYNDIEEEIKHYREWLRGKIVLCNCGDSIESAFFQYFVTNFNTLGLGKLIATSYSQSSIDNTIVGVRGAKRCAYKTVVTSVPAASLRHPDGTLNTEKLFEIEGNTVELLPGDGDFRALESEELLKQADVVVTNPPFSLFREYITQLYRHNKSFIVLGNMNAATTKEIFPLFQSNKLWYGPSIRSGDRKFYVPKDYPLNAAGCGIDEHGRKFIRVKGVRWFTNIECGAAREILPLKQVYDPATNPAYDNYDAVEVSKTANILANYAGVIGVPITFLDKYNPDQFEILMLANGNTRTNVAAAMLEQVGYRKNVEDRGGIPLLDGRRTYARILIRHREGR
jgi:modification methylase ecoRI